MFCKTPLEHKYQQRRHTCGETIPIFGLLSDYIFLNVIVGEVQLVWFKCNGSQKDFLFK